MWGLGIFFLSHESQLSIPGRIKQSTLHLALTCTLFPGIEASAREVQKRVTYRGKQGKLTEGNSLKLKLKD